MRELALMLIGCAMAFGGQAVSFPAGDGHTVYGEYYPAPNSSKPMILLFHQAGSNHAEYNPLAPKLVEMGFPCLAIDQRSGGTMWGVHNRTAAQFATMPNYSDALKDMQAAVAWAKSKGSPGVVLWGSSYSAALVFVLAAQEGADVKAVLAFSPAEYLDDSHAVQTAAAKVTCPVFIDTAKNPKEIASGKEIFNALASTRKTQFEPGTAGVHGSSTLREDRDPKGAAENWKAVNQFLMQLS